MQSNKKNNFGSVFILAFLIIASFSLFLPFILAETNTSIMDLIIVKATDGMSAKPSKSIYSMLSFAAAILPLLIMLFLNLSRVDRIVKYIINLFLSSWFLFGQIALMIVITVPFEGAKWGIGFMIGVVSSALMVIYSLFASFLDKTDKKHKIKMWYKSISTVIMVINVPALFIGLSAAIVFRELLLLLSIFNVIALIALFTATAISCFVTIKGFYGEHKYGSLHFLTGIMSLIAIAGLFYNSGASGIVVGLFLVLFFSLLWVLMGVAATKVMKNK